jgi:hypothetical protein
VRDGPGLGPMRTCAAPSRLEAYASFATRPRRLGEPARQASLSVMGKAFSPNSSPYRQAVSASLWARSFMARRLSPYQQWRSGPHGFRAGDETRAVCGFLRILATSQGGVINLHLVPQLKCIPPVYRPEKFCGPAEEPTPLSICARHRNHFAARILNINSHCLVGGATDACYVNFLLGRHSGNYHLDIVGAI